MPGTSVKLLDLVANCGCSERAQSVGSPNPKRQLKRQGTSPWG